MLRVFSSKSLARLKKSFPVLKMMGIYPRDGAQSRVPQIYVEDALGLTGLNQVLDLSGVFVCQRLVVYYGQRGQLLFDGHGELGQESWWYDNNGN
jgi:hypothetical protein